MNTICLDIVVDKQKKLGVSRIGQACNALQIQAGSYGKIRRTINIRFKARNSLFKLCMLTNQAGRNLLPIPVLALSYRKIETSKGCSLGSGRVRISLGDTLANGHPLKCPVKPRWQTKGIHC